MLPRVPLPFLLFFIWKNYIRWCIFISRKNSSRPSHFSADFSDVVATTQEVSILCALKRPLLDCHSPAEAVRAGHVHFSGRFRVGQQKWEVLFGRLLASLSQCFQCTFMFFGRLYSTVSHQAHSGNPQPSELSLVLRRWRYWIPPQQRVSLPRTAYYGRYIIFAYVSAPMSEVVGYLRLRRGINFRMEAVSPIPDGRLLSPAQNHCCGDPTSGDDDGGDHYDHYCPSRQSALRLRIDHQRRLIILFDTAQCK